MNITPFYQTFYQTLIVTKSGCAKISGHALKLRKIKEEKRAVQTSRVYKTYRSSKILSSRHSQLDSFPKWTRFLHEDVFHQTSPRSLFCSLPASHTCPTVALLSTSQSRCWALLEACSAVSTHGPLSTAATLQLLDGFDIVPTSYTHSFSNEFL